MPPDMPEPASQPPVPAEELDLRELWTTFTRNNSYRYNYDTSRFQGRFLDYLRKLTSTPDDIADIAFCARCSAPGWTSDQFADGHGNPHCEPCSDTLSSCCHCEEKYPDADLSELLNGTSACRACFEEHCSYCEECNGYYDAEADEGDHDHDDDRDDSCCASPQLAFTVINGTGAPLANDTRITITLPSVISAEGLSAIREFLYSQQAILPILRMDACLDNLGNQWQTAHGNFPKRLGSLAYKNHGIKLPPEVLARVGNLARDHSTPVDMSVEVTRDLNQSSGDFYHDGSCWWDGYSESRCALKTNGGFGLRAFGDYSVSGRAWVMPLRQRNKRLTPTFDALTPDAFVTFNGYGTLSGYTAARVMAGLAGWTYHRITFECSPMYINSNGYLIAPEPVISQYAADGLDLSVSAHASLFETEQASREDQAALVNGILAELAP